MTLPVIRYSQMELGMSEMASKLVGFIYKVSIFFINLFFVLQLLKYISSQYVENTKELSDIFENTDHFLHVFFAASTSHLVQHNLARALCMGKLEKNTLNRILGIHLSRQGKCIYHKNYFSLALSYLF